MYCPNCGREIPDESQFCGMCGTNLADIMEDEVDDGGGYQYSGGYENVESFEEYEDAEGAKPKRKKKGILIAVIAAAVVLVAIGVVAGLKHFVGNKIGGDAYVYLADGDYYLLNDLKKYSSFEFASGRMDEVPYDVARNLVSFSKDGKYVYYYTKVDDSNYPYVGSLCRAEYGKLKDDSTKNDKYIQTIASNVIVGFRALDDGTLLYRNGSNTLYWYDGNESQQIAKNVDLFYDDSDGNLVYRSGTYEDGYDLYGTSLKNNAEKVKLASNVESCLSSGKLSQVVYTKSSDNGETSFYTVGIGTDYQSIGKGSGWTYSNYMESPRKVYFAVKGQRLNSDTKATLESSTNRIIENVLRYDQIDNLQTIYCLENGALTVTRDNIAVKENVGDVIFLVSADAVNDMEIMDLRNGSTAKLAASAIDDIEEVYDSSYINSLFIKDNAIYMFTGDAGFYISDIESGVAGGFRQISDDARMLFTGSSWFYYTEGEYTNNGVTYFDVYTYSDGKEVCVARDISQFSPSIYEDNAILAYTGYQSGRGYELTMFASDGTSTIVADDVTEYIRVDDKTLLYIADGDLYVYDEKERTRVEMDVDYVWSKEQMPEKVSYYRMY